MLEILLPNCPPLGSVITSQMVRTKSIKKKKTKRFIANRSIRVVVDGHHPNLLLQLLEFPKAQ